MSLLTYKVLHILGILLAFYALGGLTLHHMNGGTKESNRSSKLTGATHGFALVLILISGFGMLHQAGYGWPLWAVAKLGIWLIIGGIVAMIRRMPQHAKLFWFLLPILGTTAAWLAIFKPF
jgi:hypothetical protein